MTNTQTPQSSKAIRRQAERTAREMELWLMVLVIWQEQGKAGTEVASA